MRSAFAHTSASHGRMMYQTCIESAGDMPRRVLSFSALATSAFSVVLPLLVWKQCKTFWPARSRHTKKPSTSSKLDRSEEHTSELQSLMRISYAVFCLKKKNNKTLITPTYITDEI